MRKRSPAVLVALSLGVVVLSTFVVSPLIRRPALIRVGPILLAAAIVLVLCCRPWKWTDERWDRLANWTPSSRAVWVGAAILGLVVFWFVLTRFRSGQINAIDFTVYYDRPIFQTLTGRPLYVESSDDPARAWRTLFAVHAHWVMLPLAVFYVVWASPLWMLALSVAAVVIGAVYTLRILQHAGVGSLIGTAAAFAFVLNDNTARALNYGFHVEVLYAWFVPWMIDAGLRRRWGVFVVAAIACIAVKEDAVLVVFAATAVVVFAGERLKGREWLYVAIPVCLAALDLVLYYRWLVPRLSATGAPFYAGYWASYGPTASAAALGMLRRPGQVLWSTLTSPFTSKVMIPHLYLPLVGWQWFVGIVPVVLLYGASSNAQLRSFGIYYAVVLVPFLVLGAAAGAERCARASIRHQGRAKAVAAAAIVFGALLGGISDAGYSLRPWKPDVAAVPQVIGALEDGQVVLVQSGLYPHAGYGSNVQLLTRETLNDPRFADAVLLLSRSVSAYPLSPSDTAPLYALPIVSSTPSGLIAVRAGRRR